MNGNDISPFNEEKLARTKISQEVSVVRVLLPSMLEILNLYNFFPPKQQSKTLVIFALLSY